MINISLENKTFLITGGGSGIGAACSELFSKAGANVVLIGIVPSELEKQKEKLSQLYPGKCHTVVANVSNESDVELAVKESLTIFPTIDGLVNCAGIADRQLIQDYSQKTIDAVIDINLKGVFYCCKHVTPTMISQKSGVIINIASIAARMGQAKLHLYAASKAGVIALTQSLARELAEHNIRANSVLPGHVLTPMWEKALNDLSGNGTEQEKERIFKEVLKDENVPLGRPQSPEDIANTVVFLCSDLANNISAQTIAVDGACTTSF